MQCAWRSRCLPSRKHIRHFSMAASDMRSPPARPTVHDRLGIFSSSPSLPDFRDLIAARPKPKPQTIRSGSAAVPIPATATAATFTSASDLLRTARATRDASFDVIDDPEPPAANKKAPAKRARKTTNEAKAPREPKPPRAAKPKEGKVSKRLAKEVIVLSSDGITPRSTRHDTTHATNTEPSRIGESDERKDSEVTPLKAKPWKKFKSPESAGRAGTEATKAASKAASTKPAAKARVRKKRSNLETVSRHFPKETDSAEPEMPEAKKKGRKARKASVSRRESVESDKPDGREKRPKAKKASTPEPSNLEAAVERRMDWTPVKADTFVPGSSPDPFGTPEHLLPSEATLFKKLSDKYGHKVPDADIATAAAPKPDLSQILGKRKIVELVSVNTSTDSTEATRGPPPAKTKAPPKKPRTITELATAAYGPQVVEDVQREDSVLDYFSVEGTDHDAGKGVPVTGKGKGKASKVTKSKKKVPLKKPVLLSPQAAMRQSAAQDFVFGTASQLACEQSPTFLKDLHAAMQASTILEEDDTLGMSLPETKLSKSKPQGKGLWSISARDEEGELVNVEVFDMINSPALPQDDAILDPWTQLPPEAAGTETETADSSVIEIGSRPIATANETKLSQTPVPKSHFFLTQKLTLSAAAALTPKSPDDSFPLVTDLVEDEMPPPSNQQQTHEEVRDSPSKVAAPAQKPRLSYETFTDAKLAKEVSKFGFKPVKSRAGMIALLDQCRKSQSQALATGATFAATSVLASPKRKQTESTQDASTPSPLAKKPRGRPKNVDDADPFEVDADVAKEVRAGPGSELVDDVLVVPQKKRGRPRKDAATQETASAPKEKLDRERKDAAPEASSMPPPAKPKAGSSTSKRKKAVLQPIGDPEVIDLDSEIEANISSPEQLFSPDVADADMTSNEDTEISLNLSPTALQSIVFGYITKAVRSAPRTTDPENPSWHEKMLMYDPIIVEDLAAWLNSGQLTKLGYDDEVSALDVKKWCEMRSICCLARETWRGQERKRL